MRVDEAWGKELVCKMRRGKRDSPQNVVPKNAYTVLKFPSKCGQKASNFGPKLVQNGIILSKIGTTWS